MKKMLDNETMAAISTPLGEGGIGIIRVSGDNVLGILKKIFISHQGSLDFKPHQMRYGKIINPANNKTIDLVLVSYMKAPKTYTKEDILEINVHGGIMPLREVLNVVLENGARLAQPGEFTKRAFLNGRIDLTQAEAVIDVIRAKTEESLKIAMTQLQGGLKERVAEIQSLLIQLSAKIELQVDFSEEDIEEFSHQELIKEALLIKERLDKLLRTFKTGKIYKEGLKVAIIGKPNVGKSSLLNELLGEERAIVTPFPGTTRDTIEETINLNGLPLQLIDTAGIRDTNCQIEKEGLKRTKNSIEIADLVLLVLDSSNFLSKEDIEIINQTKDKEKIWVINKIDLPSKLKIEELEIEDQKHLVKTSIIKKSGMEDLKSKIKEIFLKGKIFPKDGLYITNIRHFQALQESFKFLKKAIQALNKSLPFELVNIDLKEALDSLGVIVGETVSDDILNEIFSNFCIGK